VARTFFDAPSGHAGPSVKPAFLEDRFAAGEEAYDWALRNNLRLTTTAAELYEKSLPIVESTRLAMVDLAQRIGASHHWPIPQGPGAVQTVLAKLSLAAPPSDAAMLEAYRATGVRLVDYARRTKLFEVPAGYRLGKDQILELRAKAQSLLGPRFSIQRFHLEFMKQGTIPANYFAEELLRALDAESAADGAPPNG